MQPPPSEARSSVSLSSFTIADGGGAARVTSNTTSAVGTEITANAAVAVTVAATTPRREGLAATTLFPPPLAATRYRVGLHASCMGVGAMLNPIITRPLTESVGKSHSKRLNGERLKRNKEKHTGR